MEKLITGLHHITALCSNAQRNLDFYSGILGLRLVKKTVNFDAPTIYHLYYGNEQGSPGTILTFFPYPDIPRGRKGKGQLTVTSFSIPEGSIDYWIKRFEKFRIPHQQPTQRFDDEVFIYFEDSDGLGLELVVNKNDKRVGFTYGNIPQDKAIKGFHSITLCEEGYERTAHLLTELMDHSLVKQQGNRFRYTTTGESGTFVDVLCSPDSLRSLPGAGTIHHVAFASPNDKTQQEARLKLLQQGYNVTPVLDREYFHSIYYREPGNVLFEIATLPPGFAIDEEPAHLGETLKLPPWEEKNRKFIENELEPIQLDLSQFED